MNRRQPSEQSTPYQFQEKAMGFDDKFLACVQGIDHMCRLEGGLGEKEGRERERGGQGRERGGDREGEGKTGEGEDRGGRGELHRPVAQTS